MQNNQKQKQNENKPLSLEAIYSQSNYYRKLAEQYNAEAKVYRDKAEITKRMALNMSNRISQARYMGTYENQLYLSNNLQAWADECMRRCKDWEEKARRRIRDINADRAKNLKKPAWVSMAG